MDQDQGQERTQQLSGDPDQAAAQLRTEIQEVRTELGDTVEALAAKTDVKARAHDKADELKRAASEKFSSAKPTAGTGSSGAASGASAALARVRTTARQNPVPTAALGALVGGFLIGRLTRREIR